MRYKVTIESIANEKELEDEDTDELKVSHTTNDIAWSIRFCIDSASNVLPCQHHFYASSLILAEEMDPWMDRNVELNEAYKKMIEACNKYRDLYLKKDNEVQS